MPDLAVKWTHATFIAQTMEQLEDLSEFLSLSIKVVSAAFDAASPDVQREISLMHRKGLMACGKLLGGRNDIWMILHRL